MCGDSSVLFAFEKYWVHSVWRIIIVVDLWPEAMGKYLLVPAAGFSFPRRVSIKKTYVTGNQRLPALLSLDTCD